MLRRITLTVFAGAMLLCGQALPPNDGAAPVIYPPLCCGPADFGEIKQFLNLSDAQLEQLRTILADKVKARQEDFAQIQQKQTELQNLLASGSKDSLRIGQLTIEIYTLQHEPPPATDQYRQRALAVLTPEQRVKLGQLDQALKLQAPASQAVTLDLLDPPPPGNRIILATPALEDRLSRPTGRRW